MVHWYSQVPGGLGREILPPTETLEKRLNFCGETGGKTLEVTNFEKIAVGDEIQAWNHVHSLLVEEAKLKPLGK
jgi:hypothetical protein